MNPNSLNLTSVKNWQWLVILFLLVLTPINSKLAGACWLALCLLGAWSFTRGSVQTLTLEFDAAKGWLYACLSALVLIAVPQFYSGDTWGERHAEFRLLFGAVCLLGLVNCSRFTIDQVKWLGYGLVLATWAGFGWMVVFGAAAAPTNQIPWGASMALLVCVVLTLMLSASSQRLPIRLFYVSGVIAGTGAVLLSQARGSYAIVLWVTGVLLWHFAKRKSKSKRLLLTGRLLVIAIVGTLFIKIFPQLISVPMQRIEQAYIEILAIRSERAIKADTSIGIRLFLWDKAINEIPKNLWLGLNHFKAYQEIQQWGVDANAPAIKSIGHIHNNYLDIIFDRGLFGLGSFLSFIVGLLYMTLRLFKSRPYASLGIAGIFFMHSISSLTNVNFAHNYYPTMLSVAVSVCLILFTNSSDTDGVTRRIDA